MGDLKDEAAKTLAEIKQGKEEAEGWFKRNWQGMLVGSIIAWALAIIGISIGG